MLTAQDAHPWLFATILVLALGTTVAQVFVSIGKTDGGWPLIEADSILGRIGAVCVHASFVVFAVLALLLHW